jgi:hypothetical protein
MPASIASSSPVSVEDVGMRLMTGVVFPLGLALVENAAREVFDASSLAQKGRADLGSSFEESEESDSDDLSTTSEESMSAEEFKKLTIYEQAARLMNPQSYRFQKDALRRQERRREREEQIFNHGPHVPKCAPPVEVIVPKPPVFFGHGHGSVLRIGVHKSPTIIPIPGLDQAATRRSSLRAVPEKLDLSAPKPSLPVKKTKKKEVRRLSVSDVLEIQNRIQDRQDACTRRKILSVALLVLSAAALIFGVAVHPVGAVVGAALLVVALIFGLFTLIQNSTDQGKNYHDQQRINPIRIS